MTFAGCWLWRLSECDDLRLRWCWQLAWSWSANERKDLCRLTPSWLIPAEFATILLIFPLISSDFNIIFLFPIWSETKNLCKVGMWYILFQHYLRNLHSALYSEHTTPSFHISPSFGRKLSRGSLKFEVGQTGDYSVLSWRWWTVHWRLWRRRRRRRRRRLWRLTIVDGPNCLHHQTICLLQTTIEVIVSV